MLRVGRQAEHSMQELEKVFNHSYFLLLSDSYGIEKWKEKIFPHIVIVLFIVNLAQSPHSARAFTALQLNVRHRLSTGFNLITHVR